MLFWIHWFHYRLILDVAVSFPGEWALTLVWDCNYCFLNFCSRYTQGSVIQPLLSNKQKQRALVKQQNEDLSKAQPVIKTKAGERSIPPLYWTTGPSIDWLTSFSSSQCRQNVYSQKKNIHPKLLWICGIYFKKYHGRKWLCVLLKQHGLSGSFD